MNEIRRRPALLISAPASGQGKTTLTAALARFHANLGRRVRVFKVGPDFLDPMILERASGTPVYQLDLWMGGEAHCRQLLYEAAGAADLILVEGVMGLFDGNPSSADLAVRFGLPVLAVIDANAMAQTFGAVAHGLANYRSGLPFAGVLANRVASTGHAEMLQRSVPAAVSYQGTLYSYPDFALPERYLGLVQAHELADLDQRLDGLAAAVADTQLAALPEAVEFVNAEPLDVQPLLAGVRIAVARDPAFSFVYPANLDLLRAMGAELRFFSPLQDSTLPEADSLYLPGGYPELHLEALEQNRAMRDSIRAHQSGGKPSVAECGGMLYLLESLTDSRGRRAAMTGVLPGHAVMQERLTALALQSVSFSAGALRGHTFHHSRMETLLTPTAHGRCPNGGPTAEAVYRAGKLTASYLHFYFPSNPDVAARLFFP
ncbi:MAG: cobyrinate a,c-diamide synthase [Candidatus Acidiferrales bacterium]